MKCSWPIRGRPTARSRSPASSVAGSSSASTARAATSKIGRSRRRRTSGFSYSMQTSGSRRSWQEIRETLGDPKHNGYWVYRLNHFMGHPIRHGPWGNDSCLRLFRRDVGRYVGPTDHAEVELSSGAAGRLRSGSYITTCNSYSQYLPKISRYAEVQAQTLERGRAPAEIRSCCFASRLRFVQGYVLRLGFLDGLAGLQVCARFAVSLLVETSVSVAAAIGPRRSRVGYGFRRGDDIVGRRISLTEND